MTTRRPAINSSIVTSALKHDQATFFRPGTDAGGGIMPRSDVGLVDILPPLTSSLLSVCRTSAGKRSSDRRLKARSRWLQWPIGHSQILGTETCSVRQAAEFCLDLHVTLCPGDFCLSSRLCQQRRALDIHIGETCTF